jgi:predicted tellurium resistance membrane protein TerC
MDIFTQLSDWSWVVHSGAWISLLTLVALEVVLGVDNIVFISILTGKLPEEKRAAARKKGLLLAVLPRLIFLLLLGLILSMQHPLFSIPWPFEQGVDTHADAAHPVRDGYLALTGQDIVLLIGGLFLIVQAVREIHHKLEGEGDGEKGDHARRSAAGLGAVMMQIMFMNILFSLDSIITAVGMTNGVQGAVPIMIIAVLVSTVIMVAAINPVSNFVERHPSVKMLALAFLLLIGTNLIAESAHIHVPKGYVYFAMAFSVFVEMLNIKTSGRRAEPVKLHPPA